MNLEKIQEVATVAMAIIVGLPALISAMIGFFMLIPGEQPEKFLQAVLDKLQKLVDIIKKFSKK